MEINFSELIAVPRPKYAMVKQDFELEFVSSGDIEGSLYFECGDVVEYGEDEDGYIVYHGPATLHYSEDGYLQLFQQIDKSKIPDGWRYETFAEFDVDADYGTVCRIHDFVQDLILQAVLVVDKSSGELSAKIVVASTAQENETAGMMLAYNGLTYCMKDYGSKWAAITEE